MNLFDIVFVGSFTLYFLLIIAYPFFKNFLEVKQIVVLYFSILAILVLELLVIGSRIIFHEINLYVQSSSLTVLNNIVDLSLSFALTPLSYSFTLLVLVIGTATNLYILNYFKNEADEGGFVLWINSFVISMLVLVLSNNFFTLFLGWELIGFTSFFLINFWQSRRGTLKSSFKAFSFNLLSDLFLLGALVIFYQATSTTDIVTCIELLSGVGLDSRGNINWALLLLISCASIKSVQLIGHLWLPDSMEAPVPASALIHSATLVSAGIYLLARFNILLEVYQWTTILSYLGAITAAYGGVVAAAQTDMKKLLAYSTMSHCGFLMVLVSLNNFYILVIYLFLHGIYKAATFFCAGSFIRMYGSQDTRLMGGCQRLFMADAALLLMCATNLCGLPLTIGILYKTFFINAIILNTLQLPVLGLVMFGMLSSLIYFFRLVYYSTFDVSKWTNIGLYLINENNRFKFQNYAFYLNKNHMLAVIILLTFSLLVFTNFIWITTFNFLEYDHGFFSTFWSVYIASTVWALYSNYLIYFYIIYLIISILLVFIQWRFQFYYIAKINTFLFYLVSILTIIAFNISMWGQIMTEAVTIQNFNFGFSTYKSDILVHLSQWQYWWWFWFSLVWTLYFYIILQLVQKRTFQFNPVLNTSIRGHGKWGDFLVAIIPLSWCGNILVNSNFILRMIEWQNESSLFTIRIQGKQWYWVYKYDASAAASILTAPKNIGNNRWAVMTPFESYCADSYYQALHLGAQLEFKQLYTKLLTDNQLTKKTLEQNSLMGQAVSTDQETLRDQMNIRFKVISRVQSKTKLSIENDLTGEVAIIKPTFEGVEIERIPGNNNVISNDAGYIALIEAIAEKIRIATRPIRYLYRVPNVEMDSFDIYFNYQTSILSREFYQDQHLLNDLIPLTENDLKLQAHADYNAIEDTQNFAANLIEKISQKPLRIAKGILNKHNVELLQQNKTLNKPLLYTAILESNAENVEKKNDAAELLWGFRQKKYKRLQKFKFTPANTYNPITLEVVGRATKQSALTLKSHLRSPLVENENTAGEMFDYQRAVKYNRHRSELVPVTLARRLLRTKRTLVLPAHTNITVITNSYDVVHSWFIPGLGIKLDCVPGRSTHHTFYIDNVGFYYGQCAEICGRYHHHMPIRICALPFEQFLVWWQKKGLRRLHRVATIENSSVLDSNALKFRYNW